MLNDKSLRKVNESTFSDFFIKPLYESYCFSNIPQTIKNILLHQTKKALPEDVLPNTTRQYDKVVVFLIDGFGWRFFEKYKNSYPFLQHLLDKGVVSKLTTQFPSTTPAEITTINTGLPVGQHGVYEWFHYLPELDAIIAPLLFSFAGKRIRDTLISTGIDPKKIFPNETIYKELKENNIPSFVFLSNEFANSPYSTTVMQGSQIVPFNKLSEGIANLAKQMVTDKGKAYYYFYFGDIDSMAHKYGSESSQFEEVVDNFLSAMQNIFLKNTENKLDKTLLILTADHGQTAINPATTIYINKQFPEIIPWMQTNKKGELLVPVGACRDMFLHIKDECLEKAYIFLKEKLQGKAEVYTVKNLIDRGFFGPNPSEPFLKRVGNLVILSRKNESVWWYEKDKFEITYFGHHGGLTRDEAEIPFMCLPFFKNERP